MKVAIVLALLLCGCASHPDDAADIEKLRAQIASQASQLKALNYIAKDAETLSRRLFVQAQRFDSAVFDPPTNEGFEKVDTNVAPIVVSVNNIAAYGNGTRVTLAVGNMTSAELDGVTGTAKYGAAHPALTSATYLDWYGKLGTEKFSVNHPLLPGKWNYTNINLPSIPPAKFGYLEISLSVDSVSLQKH